MVCQRDNRWRLCVLSKHTTKDTLGFYVDELGAVSPALPIKIKYTRLFFVCLFCRDGTLDSLKNPARVNPIDGCLEASITPSVVDYRVFRHPLPETPRGVKKRRRGGRGRGGPKQSTIRCVDLPSEFLTVYFSKTVGLPYCIGAQDKEKVVVPSLSTSAVAGHPFFLLREYSLMNTQDVHLLEHSSNYELTRIELSTQRFQLFQIETDYPVRFVLVNPEEFKTLNLPLIDHIKMAAKYEVTNKCNLKIPGVVVSMFDVDDTLPTFSLDELYTTLQCHGSSFKRRSTPHMGFLQFHGPRRSHRVHLNPESGPGEDHFRREFHRANFLYDDQRVTFLKKVKHAAFSAKVFAAKMAPNYIHLVGKDTCDRLIWSQGMLQKVVITMNNNGEEMKTYLPVVNGCLGYANAPHEDKMDLVDTDLGQKWLSNLPDCESKAKLMSYAEAIGIGLPTTCGYNLVGQPKPSWTWTAHFGFSFFAFPLKHKLVHHFYGWAAPHFTALPVLSSGSHVRVTNNHCEEQCSVVAWGENGGYWHAKARREAAKKAKEAAQQQGTQQRATQQQATQQQATQLQATQLQATQLQATQQQASDSTASNNSKW